MEHGDFIRVRGFAGVACVYIGPGKAWEPFRTFVENDDGEEVEIEDGEGEWIDDESVARVRMVGDDHVFSVDPDDCTPLARTEFCADCGQIGCQHNVEADDGPALI